jgi:hypothetical protein
MSTLQQAIPSGLGVRMIYGCSGPRQNGVCFRLRLPYVDETRIPSAEGQFTHEWVVSRQDLDQAEQLGRSDQELLERRDREEHEFVVTIESTLRRDGLRLERVGRDLVLRRNDS